VTDYLTPAEVAELTAERKTERQAMKLTRMGVPYSFGGGLLMLKRAVAAELPQWQQRAQTARPRLDLVR
jgi:hypothetical protein